MLLGYGLFCWPLSEVWQITQDLRIINYIILKLMELHLEFDLLFFIIGIMLPLISCDLFFVTFKSKRGGNFVFMMVRA